MLEDFEKRQVEAGANEEDVGVPLVLLSQS